MKYDKQCLRQTGSIQRGLIYYEGGLLEIGILTFRYLQDLSCVKRL